jgi:hypothetical protein
MNIKIRDDKNKIITDNPYHNFIIKANTVFNLIKNQFKQFNWIFNRILKFGYSIKKPDIFLYLKTHCIIIEIDEHAHKFSNPQAENDKLLHISQDLNHLNTVVIKFNPDEYINDKNTLIKSPWYINNDGLFDIDSNHTIQWNFRINTLFNSIQHFIHNKPTHIIQIIHLFY